MNKMFSGLAGCAIVLCGCAVPELSTDAVVVPEPAPARMDLARAMKSAPAAERQYSNGAVAGDFFKQSDRAMAYTAGFKVFVKSRDKGLAEIKKLAESLDGYMVSQESGEITVKVPTSKADKFLELAKGCGKIKDFHVSSEDLTDTITDLNVRLDNLRKLRVRLTELLAKAQKVEDILKVERELNRVTTEIERLTANLKNNQNRVDYVDFSVTVIEEKGAMPSGTPQAIDRFVFLKKLASSAGGNKSYPLFSVKAPAGFVAMEYYGEIIDGFAATSSDDCIFRTWDADIADGSTLEFWKNMVCRTLKDKRSFDNIKIEDTTFKGSKAVKITAEISSRRGLQSYMAVISINERWGCDELQIVEFFGPQDAYKKHEAAVLKALSE